MARIDATENGLVKAMWTEAGVQFRSNLASQGQEIALHSHSYDHVALITHGWFSVTEIDPNENKKTYQMASKDFSTDHTEFDPVGYRLLIPAFHQHSFRLIESHDQPGEVLCLWAGNSENHEGC